MSANRDEVKLNDAARKDLRVFNRAFIETYFRTVRDALKAAAPNQLYAGCRFAWVNDDAADIAGDATAAISTYLAANLPTMLENSSNLARKHDEIIGSLLAGEIPADVEAQIRRRAAESAGAAERQEGQGLPACLLVPDRIRVPVAGMVRKSAPRLRVLAHAEIPDTHSIRIGQLIGSNR